MAKRKHHSKRHHRRVGASMLSPRSPLVMIGALAAGYFLGDTINGAIDKAIPAPAAGTTSMMPKIVMAGEIGIGGLLLLKKRKSLITTGFGGVLAGAGIRRALKTMGIVSGYQNVPVIGRRMAGYQNVPVIGGMPAQLSGTPAQLQGFRVNGYKPVGSGSNVMGSVNPVAGDASYQQAYSGGSGYMN